jgi:hypothetical protein
MNIKNIEKYQLIRRDIRELKVYLFTDNDINDWNKLIVIYNFYLFLSHLYVLYVLVNVLSKSDKSFNSEYRQIFLMFFVLCNLQNTYRYFIMNTSKINYNLANNLYKNTKEYFI